MTGKCNSCGKECSPIIEDIGEHSKLLVVMSPCCNDSVSHKNGKDITIEEIHRDSVESYY